MNSNTRVVERSNCQEPIETLRAAPAPASRPAPMPTSTLPTAIANMSTTRVAMLTNAKTRPRMSSATSLPSNVVPDRNAMPAPTPTSAARIIATDRCQATDIRPTAPPASTIDRPNQRRRDSAPISFGPAAMPMASPTKIIAKST